MKNLLYTKKMEINGFDIYERIVQMIELRGFKQKEFLTSLGITRQNLARWKTGSLPSIDILYEIKQKLDVSIDWLLTGKNEQDGNEPAAQYKIVNRIDDRLENITHHRRWERDINFYNCIQDIVAPYELQDWLNGRQNIDVSKLRKIADRLGESVQYLITGSRISKAEYTNYYGPRESEDANFYRTFSCLNQDAKENIKHITSLYFKEQIEKK